MPPPPLIKLDVQIRHIVPPIWRLIAVQADAKLEQLHHIIQEAFGWTNSHLHEFQAAKQRFSAKSADPWEDEDDNAEDEAAITVQELLPRRGAEIRYLYDFGDSWEHLITHQGACTDGETDATAAVLNGARACPPEDCGGVSGYENLVEAMKDSDHPERDDLLEWLGEPFEPERFELSKADAAVRKLMKPRKMPRGAHGAGRKQRRRL